MFRGIIFSWTLPPCDLRKCSVWRWCAGCWVVMETIFCLTCFTLYVTRFRTKLLAHPKPKPGREIGFKQINSCVWRRRERFFLHHWYFLHDLFRLGEQSKAIWDLVYPISAKLRTKDSKNTFKLSKVQYLPIYFYYMFSSFFNMK